MKYQSLRRGGLGLAQGESPQGNVTVRDRLALSLAALLVTLLTSFLCNQGNYLYAYSVTELYFLQLVKA